MYSFLFGMIYIIQKFKKKRTNNLSNNVIKLKNKVSLVFFFLKKEKIIAMKTEFFSLKLK